MKRRRIMDGASLYGFKDCRTTRERACVLLLLDWVYYYHSGSSLGPSSRGPRPGTTSTAPSSQQATGPSAILPQEIIHKSATVVPLKDLVFISDSICSAESFSWAFSDLSFQRGTNLPHFRTFIASVVPSLFTHSHILCSIPVFGTLHSAVGESVQKLASSSSASSRPTSSGASSSSSSSEGSDSTMISWIWSWSSGSRVSFRR